jgi:O6-methylguanine-DNA--protein-cysteine methyltransferase
MIIPEEDLRLGGKSIYNIVITTSIRQAIMKKSLLLLITIGMLSSTFLRGQARIENRNNFFLAESYVLFEEFEEALPLYLRLTVLYPKNYNFKYRVGQCYINIPGEKENAAQYLEDAVTNINPEYKEGKFNEEGAPFDAYYHLANAYRINNELDKALETYEYFKANMDNTIYDSLIINREIQSCHNAKEMMRIPLYIRSENLGPNVNDDNSESYPVVNEEETVMIYSKSLAFYDAILYSRKVNDVWSNPTNLNEMLRVDNELYPTSVSTDGTELYLYSTANYDGIIYKSTLTNGVWNPIVLLNENINTKYWESHATISHDNQRLYFTSNRKGTFGGLDIYVSERDSTTGDWGPAVNLGPTINTPYNEESPFLSSDDKTLYFSSRGHKNIGGYDIFYSNLLDNGEWSVPLNVGYPMNSTDDDLFFIPIDEGYVGYYAKEEEDGYGAKDIYRIEIFSENHPRKFLVSGVARLGNQFSLYNDSIRVTAMKITDLNNPETVMETYSDPETGEYQLELSQGEYEIIYEADNGQTVKRSLSLAINEPENDHNIDNVLVPLTDFVARMNIETDKEISIATGDTLYIPITIEPNSTLQVDKYLNDILSSTEIIAINDSTYVYKFVPPLGDSRLQITTTDKYGNTNSTELLVTRKESVLPPEVPDYTNVISQKQINDVTDMQISYARGEVKNLIEQSDVKDTEFATLDEQLDYLKQLAQENNIDTYEIDELAMKVALNDNILTQTAVDVLAENSGGEMKRILEELDIYEQDLKSWDDLTEYLNEESDGRITTGDIAEITDVIFDNKALRQGKEGGQVVQPMITQLARGSEGELKEILDKTDVEELGIASWDVNNQYIENESENRITASDVEDIADMILAKQSLKDAYLDNELNQEAVDLIARYADEDVREILEETGVSDLNLESLSDLANYVNSESGNNVISGQEMNDLAKTVLAKSDLIDAMGSGDLSQAAVDQLERYAGDDLSDALADLDIYEENLTTWDDLVEYVVETTNGKINPKELNIAADAVTNNDAIKNAIENNKVSQESVDQLERYADGELKEILSQLDVKEAGITTWDELLNYIDNESKGTIMPSTVTELADEIISGQELMGARENNAISQQTIDYLEKYATGELKNILAGINAQELGISNWDELTAYIEEASDGRITEMDLMSHADNVSDRESLLRAIQYNELSQEVIATLAEYADGELKEILGRTNIEQLGLENWNDLLEYIENESAGRITSGNVNALANSILENKALLDARKDNIITQEAVYQLSKHTEGRLRDIVQSIDVDKLKLKTWDDFLAYIENISNGEFTAFQINALVDEILKSVKAVDNLKQKVIAFGTSTEEGQLFMDAIEALSTRNFESSNEWLKSLVDEAEKLGATQEQIASMLTALTSVKGEDEKLYLEELIANAGEKMAKWLSSIDMTAEAILSPEDLVDYLLEHGESQGITYDELLDAFSKFIEAKDIAPFLIEDNVKGRKGIGNLWILLMLILMGAGLYWYVKKEKLL